MKIAVVSEDGINVSQHFGRATMYVVFTIENQKVVNKEEISKMGHQHFASADSQSAHGEKHGYDTAAQSKHGLMAQTINDCQVLIAGGMGWGAYDSMKSYSVEPIITEIENIEKAITLYIQGKLTNLMERLH